MYSLKELFFTVLSSSDNLAMLEEKQRKKAEELQKKEEKQRKVEGLKKKEEKLLQKNHIGNNLVDLLW